MDYGTFNTYSNLLSRGSIRSWAWYDSFSFTQLDAGDPKRCFSFVLTANADDVYEVDECRDLDEDTLDRLVKQLNETDDLSAFMLCMRRAFSATV
jgi:hypothetical protein